MSSPEATSPTNRMAVESALQRVLDPCSIAAGVPINILDMGIVREVEVGDDGVRVGLRLTSPFCFQATLIVEKIEHVVAMATGLPVRVEIDPTNDWVPEMMAAHSREELRRLRPLPMPTVRGSALDQA